MKKALSWQLVGTMMIPLFLVIFAVTAGAENPKSFYKGKRMTLLVQYPPGGSFDVQARWLARHLPDLTGAKAIVRNMPGGGGVTGYNRLYKLPPNGLTLLTAHTKLVAFDLFDRKGVKYDFSKFKYLGRVVRTNTSLLLRKELPTDLKSLRKMKRLRIGASSPFFEGLLAEMFDLPITIVPGYGGSAERRAAMLRGELDGTMASLSDGLKYSDALNIALAFRKDDKAPDVPDLRELKGKQPWRRYTISFSEIHGAVITSPGVPKAKMEFLTKALKRVAKDDTAREEAKRMKLTVSWTGAGKLKESLQAFKGLNAKEKKNLKFVIERKYVGKLR